MANHTKVCRHKANDDRLSKTQSTNKCLLINEQ